MPTDRLKLPLLAAAQAQKEVTHNEALALADIAIQAVVQAIAPTSVPSAPTPGQCWIVGSAPTGAWVGQAGKLAGWTSGGWRFLASFEGMQVWSIADNVMARREGANWLTGVITASAVKVSGIQVVGAQRPRVLGPTGGSTVDTQARAAIALLIAGLESHGLFSAT
jgi:Protein of unknown function (DUF2793)